MTLPRTLDDPCTGAGIRPAAPVLKAEWLGTVPYAEGLARQEALVAMRKRGDGEDTLLLLEHPPVITLGRGADPAHLLRTPEALAAMRVELFTTGRGGDVTYHAPGQLVGYPILALPFPLRDLHLLLRRVEEVLIAVALDFSVEAGRIPGLTGVWVNNEKLAAIGMRVSQWVTSHGFALNVGNDLSGFDLIVPCGIRDRGVTSLSRLLGRKVALEEVVPSTMHHFARVFGMRLAGEDHAGR